MDSWKPVTREGPINQPLSLEDMIPRGGMSGAMSAGGTQGHGFSMEFASVGEFLTFARTEMAGLDTSLSLVEGTCRTGRLILRHGRRPS